MKRTRHLLISGALLVAAAGCSSPQIAATGPSVEVTSVGKVLVDARGMTLYTYDKDSQGKTACTGLCPIAWPPAKAGKSAQPSDGFTVIKRPDGSRQWAHNGSPLYAFIEDDRPGDVDGNGVDGVWHVARP